MESSNRPPKSSRADFHSEVSSPVLRIVQVNDSGVVFESKESFDFGATIQLGFHVQYKVDGSDPTRNRLALNDFIEGQGIVVGCDFVAANDGAPLHEVTLLFSSMTRRDRRALKRFARLEGRQRVSDDDEDMVPLELETLGMN